MGVSLESVHVGAFAVVERLSHANSLVVTISKYGRKFFLRNGVCWLFELGVDGKVWFVDRQNGIRIDTHVEGVWYGFNHGGTLKDLVLAMRDYIVSGTLLCIDWIAPARRDPANGDIWGYGRDAAAAVRQEALLLPIIVG